MGGLRLLCPVYFSTCFFIAFGRHSRVEGDSLVDIMEKADFLLELRREASRVNI